MSSNKNVIMNADWTNEKMKCVEYTTKMLIWPDYKLNRWRDRMDPHP